MRHATPTVFASAVLLALLPRQALAHPHVFAEARLEVVVNGDREVEALRHVWRFDDVFSSTVLMEFDADKDLKLNADELKEVGAVVHQSLADFDYFQFITSNGTDIPMEPPAEIHADFTDNQLLLLFESRPDEKLVLKGDTAIGVYDPTFYTAIEFTRDEDMVVHDLPSGCATQIIRPDPDEAIAQNQDMLTEDFFNDPTGNDLSKIMATRLEVKCSE